MFGHVWPSLAYETDQLSEPAKDVVEAGISGCHKWADPQVSQQNSAMIHGSMISVRTCTFLEIVFPVSEVCLKNKKGRKVKN